MDLPGFMTPHAATVEKKLGDSAVGPRFGPPIESRAMVNNKRQQVTSADGTKVMSTAVVVFPIEPLDDVPVGSRVTFNGETRTAVTSARNAFGSLTPNHIEVRLQ